jgi:hypothetical protein
MNDLSMYGYNSHDYHVMMMIFIAIAIRVIESASRPLVGFGVLNDNLIKCLISFVEVHEQILSNRYKSIHGYITQSTIMMQMELCDQCV